MKTAEQATKLYDLYYAEYEKQDFASKSVAFKINIVCGLLWYYGVLRKDAEAVKFWTVYMKIRKYMQVEIKFLLCRGNCIAIYGNLIKE